LAGALAEIANETLKNDFRRINPQDARIILMEGGNRVLAAYPPDLSEKAERLVKRLGVEVMKGVMATAIDGDGVAYKRGDTTERLAAKTVLWAGGVMANLMEAGRPELVPPAAPGFSPACTKEVIIVCAGS